jgi:CRP-like cAMP-binding protein
VHQGKFNDEVFFIKAGNLMTYFELPNKNSHVIQFGKAGWWTGDVEIFFNKKISNLSVKSMIDTSLLILNKESFEQLLEEAPNFERYFRILYQKLMRNFQGRIFHNVTLSADQRYNMLLKDFPKCELIFPQKYIAAYLAITPEFLCKMKARAKDLEMV